MYFKVNYSTDHMQSNKFMAVCDVHQHVCNVVGTRDVTSAVSYSSLLASLMPPAVITLLYCIILKVTHAHVDMFLITPGCSQHFEISVPL